MTMGENCNFVKKKNRHFVNVLSFDQRKKSSTVQVASEGHKNLKKYPACFDITE